MLPEILKCNAKRDIPMTLTKEALKSFDTMRPRPSRSASRDSLKSRTSGTSDMEDNEQVFDDIVFPVVINHPSPVHDSSSEGPDSDGQLESHAYELHAQLEVASTFGRVSSLSFTDGLNNSGKITRSIFSFAETHTDSLHVSPKIRRSSTPCVSLSSKNNIPSQHSMPYLGEENSEVIRSTSQTSISRKVQKPRKRSWDSRLPSENST